MLQALRSLPQSITWRPLTLDLVGLEAQNTVLELCAALAGTPLAQAVSKLSLCGWKVESPIATLRASFPNVLQFGISFCNKITASSLSAAVAAWPMLQSINLTSYNFQVIQEPQQHLEAAAELKAGRPFEVSLQIRDVVEGDAAIMDVLVAAVHNAGGGKVDVRWVHG